MAHPNVLVPVRLCFGGWVEHVLDQNGLRGEALDGWGTGLALQNRALPENVIRFDFARQKNGSTGA